MSIQKIEYRVRECTRYYVTRYEKGSDGVSCGGSAGGEYTNELTAHAVAYALCRAEHERLGWPLGDERIQYPRDPYDSAPEQPDPEAVKA